jgi:hypothetical protein
MQRFLEFRCNWLRMPGFVTSAEVIFGMPDQTLPTRHDSGPAPSRSSTARFSLFAVFRTRVAFTANSIRY